MSKLFFLALLFVCPIAATATPVLTLLPPSASGAAGQLTGWGFELSSGSNQWISIVDSFIYTSTDPLLGSYTDLIGLQGGPTNAVLAPQASNWVQGSDPQQALGLGSFRISMSASAGAIDSGLIAVLYDTFSADPNLCQSCQTGTGQFDVNFSVIVVPEPSSFRLLALCTLLSLGTIVAARRSTRRYRHRSIAISGVPFPHTPYHRCDKHNDL